MRTYDRDTFLRARAAWEEGEFGEGWDELRRLSWEQGFPFPPAGDRWDSIEDDEPSQRAIIWYWLDARPSETLAIIRRSRSWHQVVSALMGTAERLREDANLTDRDAVRDRDEQPTHREAVMSIAGILGRIDDSR